jgi:hypothetical protein
MELDKIFTAEWCWAANALCRAISLASLLTFRDENAATAAATPAIADIIEGTASINTTLSIIYFSLS